MADNWYAGVLTKSSWHRKENVEPMADAAEMIRRGEETGAWPVSVDLEDMTTETGLDVPGKGIVATYHDGSRKVHKAVSDSYVFLDPAEWRAGCQAAVKAGARPAGVFALGKHGSKVLATFEIDSSGKEGTGRFRNFLTMVDSMDQSSSYCAGGTSIRVVCANTFAASMAVDGKRYARLRHTKSINDKAELLRGAIEEHVKQGSEIASLYADALELRVQRDDALALIDELWPIPGKDDGKSAAGITKATNLRAAAVLSMKRPENAEGPTLATLWNAATWMVDRDELGNPRTLRGGADPVEALLFGTRGKRIEKVRQVMVRVLRPDGTEEDVTAQEAAQAGVDNAQIGRQLMSEMFN